MREIKIRGQRKYSEEWNYLHLSEYLTSDSKPQPEMLQYLHRNIGQFTGLKDKNGVEIYEGDIVRILYTDWSSKSDTDPRTLDQYLIDIANIGEIEFYYDSWEVKFKRKLHKGDIWRDSIRCGKHGYIEVIGNIHENPELLTQHKN